MWVPYRPSDNSKYDHGDNPQAKKLPAAKEAPWDISSGAKWSFLTHSHPQEAKAYRKEVRSHVTRIQHARKRSKPVGKETGDLDGEDDGEDSAAKSKSKSKRTKMNPKPALQPMTKNRNILARRPDPGNSSAMTMTSQLAMARCDPFTVNDATADWHDDVANLVCHYLGSARDFLQSNGFPQESRLLRADMVLPELYIDSFLFNALITLTTTRIGVTQAKAHSVQLNTWLRNNFIIMIRTAIEKGGEDPKILAVGLALLIGWEVEFGDQQTCFIHSQALPSLLVSEDFRNSASLFSYPDRGEQNVFRGGTTMSSGFEFYAKQDLLPRRLLFLISSLNYFDPVVPGARRWMRELWASIGACVPTESTAKSNLQQRELRSRVAQLVRQAGYMLGSFMRFSANEPPAAQPLTEGITALQTATVGNDWDSIVGTIYDEILFWSLCVFCTTSNIRAEEHISALKKLLKFLDITRLGQLYSLLERYICPPCIHIRLTNLWIDLQNSEVSDLTELQPAIEIK